MTLLRLGPDALPASRFAVSPLAEVFSELDRLRRALDQGSTAPDVRRFARWLPTDPFAEGLVRLITATKCLPDFVAVPPAGGPAARLRDELATMRTVDDVTARAMIEESQRHAWASPGTAWADVDGLTARAADVFAAAWQLFVEPDWPRRRAVLERDIHHRAGVIARSGWRDAVAGMAPGVRWVGHDAIEFSTQSFADRHIGGDGLIFVPHTGRIGRWTCESADHIAFVYPAMGVLAEAPPAVGGPAALLGHGRTRILLELRTSSTPSQLSTLLGVSLGTVSAHLAALRDAGAVTARRSGRSVYYALTPTGDALVQLVVDPPTGRRERDDAAPSS